MSWSCGIGIMLWMYLLNITVHGQVPGPNAVAIVNGQTMLDCKIMSIIDLGNANWRRTSDGTKNPLPIAFGCNNVTGNNTAYYRTERIGSSICRLIIANITMQQAGVYACYDGAAFIYQSLVTVIDSAASVVVHNQSEMVEGDQLNISCSINYTGPASPAPSLRPLPQWITSPGQIFTSVIYYSSANVVTLVATLTVHKPTVRVFRCGTVFEVTGTDLTYNLSAPADSFAVGSTTEIDVQYNASTPEIIESSECGTIALTCKSSGNPPPKYKWYHWNETVSIFITEQQILKSVEINEIYMCEVYNTIRNVNCSSSVNYSVSKSDSSFPCSSNTSVTNNLPVDPSTTIGLAVGLGGYGLLNIIATIVFLWYYNRKSKTASDGREIYTCRNKSRLNARFPWLQNMLPCLNESRGNAGCTFLWVLLFILMSVFAGIVFFPILVAMANCSQETRDAKGDSDIGMSNVYQEDTTDRRGASKSSTDAHGHVEAPYDEIGTMHPGRKVVLEEESTSSNPKDAKKVFYTKVNPNFNAEEDVQRYSVSLSS